MCRNKLVGIFVLTLLVFSVSLVLSSDVRAQRGCTMFIEVETIPDSATEFMFTLTGDITDEFTIDPFSPRSFFFRSVIQ